MCSFCVALLLHHWMKGNCSSAICSSDCHSCRAMQSTMDTSRIGAAPTSAPLQGVFGHGAPTLLEHFSSPICRQVIFPIPVKWFQQSATFPSTSILLKHNFSVLEVLLPGAPEVPPAWPEDFGCSNQKSRNFSLKAALVWPWPMEL